MGMEIPIGQNGKKMKEGGASLCVIEDIPFSYIGYAYEV